VDAVADASPILFLGAGASLQAGLPSAAAFVEAMVSGIQAVDDSYAPAVSGSMFNSVATDFESVLGSGSLTDIAKRLVNPPFLEEAPPASAHVVATRLFDTVVTTNYDLLLERAIEHSSQERPVITGDAETVDFGKPLLIKLHGSVAEPASLTLTEAALANLEREKPALWRALGEELRHRPLIAVGSSLRDPSIVRLLEDCRQDLHGWVVLPTLSVPERERLKRWNLSALEAPADAFFEALAVALQR
jgi:hypothetical protein